MALTWNGDDLARRARLASQQGIDATMAACVIHAKTHHPFTNRTATAEGSISIYQYATVQGGVVRGLWGSADVLYFIFLELGTSRSRPYPTLRPAADAEYPKLTGRMQRAFRRAR